MQSGSAVILFLKQRLMFELRIFNGTMLGINFVPSIKLGPH